MKQIYLIFIIISLLFGCSRETKKVESGTSITMKTVIEDTTPKVTGIGGIFFGSENPKEIREWYSEKLGIVLDDYGAAFEFRNANRPEEINYLRWTPMKQGNDYFLPSKKELMINYRVQNIEGMVRNLKGKGVTVLDSISTYEYGKFVHIMDPEGNKIELWEPIDSILTKIGSKTTK